MIVNVFFIFIFSLCPLKQNINYTALSVQCLINDHYFFYDLDFFINLIMHNTFSLI